MKPPHSCSAVHIRRRRPAYIVRVCGWWLINCWGVAAHAGVQELPSEAELPGRSSRRATLPPESALPSSWRPAEIDSLRQPPAELPSEAELPPANRAATKPEPANGGGEQIPQRPPDPAANGGDPAAEPVPAEPERPWLRLMLNGPAAPLRAVQFSADSRRLLAGGDDKALHVWQFFDEVAGVPARWTYDQAIPWQVQRGVRGAIRAIAADSQSILFGGIGATPLTAEIARIDPQTLAWDRCLYDLQDGTQGEIQGLAMVGPDRWAALDVQGQVVLWQRDPQTGLWLAERIRAADAARFPPAAAESLARFRRLGSALAGSDQGVLLLAEPVPADNPRNPPQWQLLRRDIATGRETILTAPQAHAGSVPALALSANGQRIVSADLTDAGRWFRWDLARSATPTIAQFQFPVRSVAVSRSGEWLLLGSGLNAAGKSQVALYRWDPEGSLRPIHSWSHERPILASCFSPDEQWLAFAVGSDVQVQRLDRAAETPLRLAGLPNPVEQIAFSAAAEHPYRVVLRRRSSEQPDAESNALWIFDPQNPGLTDAEPAAAQAVVIDNPQSKRWELRSEVDSRSGQTAWQVVVGGQVWGRLPLDSNADGFVTASCWLPAAEDPSLPQGLVVGTNKNNQVYVYRLAAGKDPTLVRQYRGHEAAVRAVSAALDRRYLVSLSADSTIRFWKLDDAVRNVPPAGDTRDAWGSGFDVEDGQLLARDVIADGPLYFRGVREGDRVVALAWTAANTGVEQRVDDPAAILAELRQPVWRRMLRFETERAGVAQPTFYLHPAWQPLATLLVTADREWAYWTPYGYYDASFNGHQRFGWQFNRGVDRGPELFRAAELKESWERPDLLRQLLSQGSAEGAFQALRQTVPAGLHTRLAGEQRLRPRIEILAPQPATEILTGNAVEIIARIAVPRGVRLEVAKAFVNGVPAREGTRKELTEAGDWQPFEWRWRVDPPRDRRLRIQVAAATDQGGSDVAHCDLQQIPADIPAARPPQVFLIAAGVGNYRDGQIPQLAFAENNARALRQVLHGSETTTATLPPTMLLGNNASRTLWRAATAQTIESLQTQAGPDDLLVLFLSGHGVSDPQTGAYFFVTPNARYADLMARRYGDCISLAEFEPFAALPCRKLVILDTCESGTFAGRERPDLKPLVRWLENDLFFTLTSAEGNAAAFESAEDRLSFFTASLVQGLQGAADAPDASGHRDGRVEWSELARYVMAQVPAAIARVGKQQYPTAAPKELLEFAEIPLVAVGSGE